MKLPRFISKRVPQFVRKWRYPHLRESPIYGLGKKLGLRNRALLSYITWPFRQPPGHPDRLRFSNCGIAVSLVRVLNELGYVVDVVEWTDAKFVPRRPYDLFIGHGAVNFERLSQHLPAHTPKVFFAFTYANIDEAEINTAEFRAAIRPTGWLTLSSASAMRRRAKPIPDSSAFGA